MTWRSREEQNWQNSSSRTSTISVLSVIKKANQCTHRKSSKNFIQQLDAADFFVFVFSSSWTRFSHLFHFGYIIVVSLLILIGVVFSHNTGLFDFGRCYLFHCYCGTCFYKRLRLLFPFSFPSFLLADFCTIAVTSQYDQHHPHVFFSIVRIGKRQGRSLLFSGVHCSAEGFPRCHSG